MHTGTSRHHRVNGGVKAWINGSSVIPEWIKEHMLGPVEANGAFLIRTRGCQARVHRGHTIVEHLGSAYTCEAHETAGLIERLRAEAIVPGLAVGPGKRLDRSGASPVPKRGRAKVTRLRAVYPEPLGSLPTIEWIHVGRLSIDAGYQRSIDNEASRRLIASIAANFDWRLCAPLVVSRRSNGDLIVIDGQHRTMAARLRRDIPQLPCCVFSYAGPEEEARMFIAANRARKPMNRLDDFHAALAAADEDALEIQILVTDAGLKVARNTSSTTWRPCEIAFTATIATSVRKYGPAVVSAALTDMAEAFPKDQLTHSGSIFLGLVKILSQPPKDFDPDRLFEALKQRTAEQWGQAVLGLKGGNARASVMRQAMLDAYGRIAPDPRKGLPSDNLANQLQVIKRI